MIDLPVGKALIAVYAELKCKQECNDENYYCKVKDCCKGCYFHKNSTDFNSIGDCDALCCISVNRKDERNIVFKLVDYPVL